MTFGKEDSLRYPTRLEQALRRLHSTVDLSLPSLEARDEDAVSVSVSFDDTELTQLQIDALSFYESDDSVEDVQRAFKSPRVKESPFRISKSARKSSAKSPAVSTPGSRRSPARKTPRVRLRHDNSQILFEPITSSPSNPFAQESQILTERQKEMIERQRLSGGLFANMAAPSPQKAPSSPMEIHSDALTADDLPVQPSHTTPLKALAVMGPMDGFLGSSPTPHARRSTRHIASNNMGMTTPTAVRTVKLANNDELGSSPPQFEKRADVNVTQPNKDILVGSSFEYKQPENSYDASFDEGTTIDEAAMLAAANDIDAEDLSKIDRSKDIMRTDVPSFTIDLQLTAQLDADIQAHIMADKPDTESNNEFVDATSHAQSSFTENQYTGSDTEVDSEPASVHTKSMKRDREGDTSSTSRVGDSFNKPPSIRGTPQSERLRRSSRHSLTSSPNTSPSKKKKIRKQTPAKSAPEVDEPLEEHEPTQQSTEPQVQPDEGGMLDNIVVASPKHGPGRPKKRKSMNDAESPTVHVPETNRKRGPVRRSQSTLSQVENSQDLIVEDTPAPKRARQNTNQDVSEARRTPPAAPDSQTKRVSHVQVTPKRPSDSLRGSSVATSIAPSEPQEPEQNQTSQPAIVATPSRSFADRVILTPRSIIQQLKSLKDFLFKTPQLVLGRDEERQIDDALFDIRRQVHAAGVRGEERKDGERGFG